MSAHDICPIKVKESWLNLGTDDGQCLDHLLYYRGAEKYPTVTLVMAS